MTNLPQRPIHAPEEVFQFIQDCNTQRQDEIRHEEMVDRLSKGYSILN